MKSNFCHKCEYADNDVRCFVDRYGIDLSIAKLMSARGVTRGNVKRFFKFDTNNFYNPLTMHDMEEGCAVIKDVMLNKGSILVYGDYDADGLTAASILRLYFEENEVDCDVIIPTRSEGYGLNVGRISEFFDKKHYSLIITVDCGISNKEEITQILSLFNTNVIVTDHHEVPEELPPCICINPKLGYAFANLSGAGVAFKLVQALSGIDAAAKYADLAALGTIADMMPLVDENRDIVKFGLANFNHKGLNKLAEASGCNKPYTAHDLALRIAPKINAAGRVGDVYLALRLLSDRHCRQSELVATLVATNEERRVLLEELFKEAESKNPEKTVFQDNLVFLYDDEWPSGILGIAANRFKDLYNVPAVILARDGDNYVGSARGVDGVDLHELFSKCADLLVKYGGHKASVGFTVSAENLLLLKDELARHLKEYPVALFNPAFYYDLPFEERYLNKDFMDALDLLQPILPNYKPIFHYLGFCRNVQLFGQEKNHIKIILDNKLELKGYFRFSKYYAALATNCECEVLFSLEIDKFTGMPTGVIHHLKVRNSIHLDDIYAQNYIRRLNLNYPKRFIKKDETEKLLKQKNTLVVFNSYLEYEHYAKKFDFSDYFVDLFSTDSIYSQCVFISPSSDCMFRYYKNIICFGNYNGLSAIFAEGAYIYNDKTRFPSFLTQHIDRDICLVVYKAIRQPVRGSMFSYFNSLQLHQVTYSQFLLSLKVFEELGLVKIQDPPFNLSFTDRSKAALLDSHTYNFFNLF